MNDLKRATLLVEIGCEELPPKSLDRLAEAFFTGVCSRLEQAGIEFDANGSRALYSPRRLALQLIDVAGRQPDREIDRRGPALQAAFDDDGKPTRAAEGFARSVDRSVAELETVSNEKGEWLFCRIHEPGQALEKLLFPLLQEALDALPIAKPMRWASHSYSFVRPVHWLVAMHGQRVLDGELFGQVAGCVSAGHRVHHPQPVEIAAADDYLDALEAAHVLADPARRKSRVERAVREAGEQAGGVARITDGLLGEVSNLVEWPVAVLCSFDEEFLTVPPEALVASMEDHQKFFPVLEPENGSLKPLFVAVANLESKDIGAVRSGFERVIRPRLADAKFFWQQDRKQPLDHNLEALDGIVFQAKLGTVGDKSRRIASLSLKIADELHLDGKPVHRAGLLCKCDLVSLMVGEFPELQGTMGGYYATESGEAEAVAAAIAEHYAPRFSGDRLPAGAEGRLLSLADRVDTLTAVFAVGLKPSGNKDPFALRRAALGVIRLLTEGGLDLQLDRLLQISAECLEETIDVTSSTRSQVRTFILDRARQYFRDQGVATRVVDAALAAPLGTLLDFRSRLLALADFMQLPGADALVAANKRIGNILRKSDVPSVAKIREDGLVLDEERRLFAEVCRLEKALPELYDKGDYAAGMALLAELESVVDLFFDQVMVMDENPEVRANRLALLVRLKSLFDRVADFSLAA